MGQLDGQKRANTLPNSTDGKLFYVDFYVRMDLIAFSYLVGSKSLKISEIRLVSAFSFLVHLFPKERM